MTSRSLVFVLVGMPLALVGCSSSSASGTTTTATTSATTTTTGAGGAGGAATTTAAGGAGGAGGASTTTGAGGSCHGDDTQWKALTTGPVACQKNSDCCVIVNGCISAAQIVAEKDVAAAKGAWPYCDSECNNCIPPAIVVACNAGACTGKLVDFADGGADLIQDHCGVDPTVITETSKLLFTCGG